MYSSRALFALLIAPGILPAQEYFPPGILDKNPQFDELKVNLYSKHLKALHEPSLWELSRQDPNAEAYRFLWLRSFNHPIAVRLMVRTNGSGWMNSRMTTGQGGFKPGRISRYSVSWLRKGQTQAFLAAFENANFWNLPTLPDADENAVELDGAQWIIEGVRNGTYHIVDRWSPEAGDAVRVIGIMALKLGRFKIRSTEVY
jgi:hypothetical protein